MSAKQAINDKLQDSVAVYLRCGRVVNSQIKKGLLLSLRVNFFKSVNIWQCYKQERDCLVHFVRLAKTMQKDGESGRSNIVQLSFFPFIVEDFASFAIHLDNPADTTTSQFLPLLSISVNMSTSTKITFLI